MMNRFLCFRSFCKKRAKDAVDSEKAESPAFVAEEPAVGDAFNRLSLRESPHSYRRTDLWCDKTTQQIPAADLWRDEPTFTRRPVVQPRLPAKYKKPERRTARVEDREDREVEKRKDREDRESKEEVSSPAEKKARTEPSSYAVPLPESESD